MHFIVNRLIAIPCFMSLSHHTKGWNTLTTKERNEDICRHFAGLTRKNPWTLRTLRESRSQFKIRLLFNVITEE